jgi:hypothetical protein
MPVLRCESGSAQGGMSSMEAEVFEAFKAAGVPDEVASKAGQALNRRDVDVSSVRAEIVLLRWMVGFGLALDVAILLKLFVK